MAQDVTITEKIKDKLYAYITENSNVELINAYLYFIQNKFKLQPVLYPKSKVIFISADEAMTKIQSEQEIWREAEIKITFSHESVNDETKKIYICPFSGRVFGDNTHPNPQDAIYDWVSKCPENTERFGGLRVKRFFVSDDPGVIQSYLEKHKPKEPIKKKVFSSAMSGKIFSTKESVLRDFKENYLRPMTLLEVQSQNKFSIEEGFLEFIQAQLVEDKVAAFIEALAGHDDFLPYVQKWLS